MIISASPIGLLLWASLYYFLGTQELFALVMAVLMHELGHIITLGAMSTNIRKITIDGAGLCIDYIGELSPSEEFFAAIAGPTFGMVWYVVALQIGEDLSANLSLVLSVYNLLPFSILDGGRAVSAIVKLIKNESFAKKLAIKIDRTLCVLLAICGIYCVFAGIGVAILISSCWLAIYVLVKPPSIV